MSTNDDKILTPDLDALAHKHADEERAEAQRSLLENPRPSGFNLPAGGILNESKGLLDRLYAGDRMAKEKKPGVFDHFRSVGPWMVSVDDDPLSVLDGMSQTATLCAGFAEDPVVSAYFDGGFNDALLQASDTTRDDEGAARAYAEFLKSQLPGLKHVSFANSGSEANEKALALARLNAPTPEANRVLAFQGGFHGRTLLSLHSTWSPKKREPFEFAGVEARFVALPRCPHDAVTSAPEPEGYLSALAAGNLEEAKSLCQGIDEPLIHAEMESLIQADEALRSGRFFACIIEPMQSEGGESYITARFARAVRVLTRKYGVSLIIDEVQTGFGLGGTFFWHHRFNLVDAAGAPDVPDAVTCAKRAQVGVCISRFDDPEPTCVDVASLIRGKIHGEMVAASDHPELLKGLLEPRLRELEVRFPELISEPRYQGYAFAFDLPSPDHLKAYLAQRFWRGAVVFGSGTRTARYRLSAAYGERELTLLFATINATLGWLEQHPGEQPPAWQDEPSPPSATESDTEPVRIRTLPVDDADAVFQAVLDLERRTYEEARRDPEARLRLAFEDKDGVGCIAEVLRDGRWQHAGYALGAPLESFAEVAGPSGDSNFGRHNTMYSIAITVDQTCRGLGIGRRLKAHQLARAETLKKPDGSPRYRYATGRNRVGLTDAMTHLNRQFGAYTVDVLSGQYEGEGQALYYRIPLKPWAPAISADVNPETQPSTVDCSSGIFRPLSNPPRSLVQARDSGALFGPAVNKITLCNYVTPAIVRSVEWVTALVPELPHFYLCSSRDEAFDKALKLMKSHRDDAVMALGFEGGYVGHTSAAARSLSDPGVHQAGPSYFDFDRIRHPEDVGSEASLKSLREKVAAAGGADRVLALFVEVVQEKTGRSLSPQSAAALSDLCRELGIPIVAVETASSCYRSGLGAFAATAMGLEHVAKVWWGGGHVAFVHVSPSYFVPTPLTMVSTWDGDELSLIRHHHQLRAARNLDISGVIRDAQAALQPIRDAGIPVYGLGLYWVIHAGDNAARLHKSFRDAGVEFGMHSGGMLSWAPSLDIDSESVRRVTGAISEVMS